jgi:uncharacterized membrane protein (DUF373 family)
MPTTRPPTTIGIEDTPGATEHEPAPVAETRDRLARVFGYVEDAVYVGLAVLLAGMAVVLLGASAVTFWRHMVAGELAANIVSLLDQLLLVLMVVEILYTVQVSFREHVLTAPPFLLVGLIAAVRRIVVLTAESHKVMDKGEPAFRAAMIELALLILLSVGLASCLYLLRARPNPGAVQLAAERAPSISARHDGQR